MIIINAIKHNFLKAPVRVLSEFRRNTVSKKSRDWMDNLLTSPYNFEKVQNSNITPKGFEVIYVSPMYLMIKLNYFSLPLLWGLTLFDVYTFFTKEDYMTKLKENLPLIKEKDKILQCGVTLFFLLVLQVIPSRAVMATFRKENEFKTLLYGFFGPLTKKYVSHGYHAMEQTNTKGIYNFKGKKVFLPLDGFRNHMDIESVVRMNLH